MVSRILGLDVGDKWTGVACSDPLGIICRPLKTVLTEELADFLLDFLQNNIVLQVVYGLPLDNHGRLGVQAKKTELVINEVKKIVTKRCKVSVEFIGWDERRTSVQASSVLRLMGKSSKESRVKEDSVAAALILQSYMDFRRSS